MMKNASENQLSKDELQKRLKEAQDELNQMDISGEAANGSVRVICDGKGLFKSIKLSAEAINSENPSSVSSEDIEMLEDLLSQAFSDATKKANDQMEAKMKSITGGINIPGLF